MIDVSYVYLKSFGEGGVYAAKLDENNTVLSCCGPLYYVDVTEANLPGFDYDAEDAEWLEAHTERIVQPPYSGDLFAAELARLGRKGGSVSSEAKRAAAAANGRKGGRPKKAVTPPPSR